MSTATDVQTDPCRPFLSTERHPTVTVLRQLAFQRGKEVEMIGTQLALLIHNAPENDNEITRWIAVLDRTIYHLRQVIGAERTLRDIEGRA